MADEVVTETRRRLGAAGVWLFGGNPSTVDEQRTELSRLDRLGYGSVWTGESVGGRDIFARFGRQLAQTGRIAFGTGIANVWSRAPETMQAGGLALAEGFPGRVVLGIGIGHVMQAELAGQDYGKPLSRMRDYLHRMDDEAARNPPPVPFPRVIGAVGPKMLELSREHADGAHPFYMPIEHTVTAREILGPDKLLIPHQAVLLETDPGRARDRIRENLKLVLGVPAYAAGYRGAGYADDLADLPDRIVDAAVAWGDAETVAKRVRAQLDAGADHVLVSPITDSLSSTVDHMARLAGPLGIG